MKEAQQVMAHQPAISFSISFLSPFNRAGGRTSNVGSKTRMKHKGIKLTLFAIVLVAAVAVSLDLWESQAAKLQSFSYRHRVTVTDHATGKILWPTVSLPGTSNTDAFPQPAGVTALEDGSVLITGEGSEPRQWVFSHEGYEPVSLRIGRDSVASYDVQIKLSRTK